MITAKSNGMTFEALKEAPGLWKTDLGYFFLEPQTGWKGPYPRALDAAVARVAADFVLAAQVAAQRPVTEADCGR